MSATGPDERGADISSGPGPDATPARAQASVVDGLAVVRRRRDDLAPGTPTVLLVHGAMDRAASFGRVMRRLPDLDVVALDRRGYGDSLGAGVAPTLADHVDDLQRVLDWSGATTAVVVGHSLGGTLALQLGTRGDERVRGLGAFECPLPQLDGSHDRVGAGSVQVSERDGAAAAAEFFYRLMVGEGTWDRLRERDREARRAEGPALMAELTDLRRTSTTVELAQVTPPVVMGVGELSRDDLRRTAADLRDLLPDAWMIEIAGAGHGAHLSHADEFARYVRACVTRAEFADDALADASPGA